ncbi:2Fe-2S iron-sulfur cluster-binding protein [Aestuariivirga sp.]
MKYALTGNVCRCTGYERIVEAIMSLSKNCKATAP